MDKEKLFTIGEIYHLTKVPRSALRYYDEVGVIKPVHIDAESGYRYYDNETLILVLVMRYYQILGFRLKEIPKLLARDDLSILKEFFYGQVEKDNEAIVELTLRRDSLISWIDLIEETQEVIEKDVYDITLEAFPKAKMIMIKPKPFPKMEFRNLLINNDICVNLYGEGITALGALYIEYPSETLRFGRDFNGITLYIKNHDKDDDYHFVQEIKGFSAVTCYHRGSYDTIKETYEKMKAWARIHNFDLKGNSIERYVIDYWSTTNENCLLTQIYLPIS